MRLFFLLVLSISTVFASGEFSNRRAPGFSLSDLQAQQHDPQDYRGKVLLVEIMQADCPHCNAFAPILEQAVSQYKGKVAVLSIVTQPDTAKKVQDYITRNKVKSPVLFDCGQVIASYLKITPQNPNVSFPHVFLIDGKGMIRNDFGYTESTKQLFEAPGLSKEIDKLLAGVSK